MNRWTRTMLMVMRKEWLDFFRDRRTFLLSLLVAPLLYPLMFLGIGKLSESRVSTELEKPMTIQVAGGEHAPTLLAHLASYGINARKASEEEVEAAIRRQDDNVGLVIDPGFGKDWHAGTPAKVELVTDSTRRNADMPVRRVEAAIQQYSRTVGALRLLARGVNPVVGAPLAVGTRDLATLEAKRSSFMTGLLPMILTIFAFIGGAHLAMDTTAGERERQSLEPLLATPAPRAALVGGKMLAAVVLGLLSMLLILLSFKVTATLVSGLGRQMDVSFLAMGKLLLTLLPLVLIGSALITALAAGAKSMKEAGSHMMWLMMLPMLPAFGLMVYPLKDTTLWHYAVPFLSQHQLIQKISRGEAASPEQWGVYLLASLALGAVLWTVAIWRYKQEKLAISA